MEYRNLGKSNYKVSVISFGAWAIGGWMWGGADESDAIEAINTAIDHGMTSIDTAPIYGFGKSEEIVGNVIKDKRDKVEILTKYGLRWDTDKGIFYFKSANSKNEEVSIHRYAGPESIIQECEDSLKRLQTDYIDLYQIHWHDPTTPIDDTMEAIGKLKKDGKILAAGVSNYTSDQMKEADRITDIVTNQVPYSMVLRDIEKDLVPYCLQTGKGILAYSPLQRGVLTGKITSGYTFNPGDHRPQTPYFKEPNLSRINEFLKRIEPIAMDHGITLAQLVIFWTIRQPAVTSALVGARNAKQVKENLKAGEINIGEGDILTINKYLEDLHLDLNV
jgi:aryl-alcohol dehydrogenase-like predicted oxidoreductase